MKQSQPLSTVVVEDERLPRLSLLKKLEEFTESVEVVAACDNYDDALQTIARLRPALLMLDIQLQGRDTIALLDELKESIPLPMVIFTTAYSDRRYLMGAIKVNAVDYLMKPINRNELAGAIAKAVERADTADADGLAGNKLSFRTVSGRLFLEPDDIAAVRADGNYSRFVTFDAEETVLESLAALERRLDKATFVRADRSTIINVSLVYRLNAKRQQCTLHSPSGAALDLELSKTAIDTLMRLM